MKINLNGFNSIQKISIILFLIPRTFIGYPFNLLATYLLLKGNRRDYLFFSITILIFLLAFYFNSFFFNIQFTQFFFELLIIAPLIFFVITNGKGQIINQDNVRFMSLSLFMLSILNMIINFGFPFNLPYIDFTQDAFSAFFGGGGPKIITIFGFICLLYEIFYVKKDDRSFIWMFFALSNFIIPNYVTGIVLGFFSLAIVSFLNLIINHRSLNFGYVIIIIFSLIFAFLLFNFRFDNIGRATNLLDNIESVPRAINYLNQVNIINDYPHVLFFGFGLGQYSGELGYWSIDYIGRKMPINLEVTEPLQLYFLPLFSDIFIFNRGYMSTISQPSSSYLTIINEFGLFFGLIFVLLFFRTIFQNLGNNNVLAIGLSIFFGLYLLFDNQHDNTLFIFSYIFTVLAFKDKDDAINNYKSH